MLHNRVKTEPAGAEWASIRQVCAPFLNLCRCSYLRTNACLTQRVISDQCTVLWLQLHCMVSLFEKHILVRTLSGHAAAPALHSLSQRLHSSHVLSLICMLRQLCAELAVPCLAHNPCPYDTTVAGRVLLICAEVCLRDGCSTADGSLLAAITASAVNPQDPTLQAAATRFIAFAHGLVDELETLVCRSPLLAHTQSSSSLPPTSPHMRRGSSGTAFSPVSAADSVCPPSAFARRDAAATALRAWLLRCGVPYMEAFVSAAASQEDKYR
jgi:hypothetical protein